MPVLLPRERTFGSHRRKSPSRMGPGADGCAIHCFCVTSPARARAMGSHLRRAVRHHPAAPVVLVPLPPAAAAAADAAAPVVAAGQGGRDGQPGRRGGAGGAARGAGGHEGVGAVGRAAGLAQLLRQGACLSDSGRGGTFCAGN